jgi:hypothetical protein
MLVCTMKPAPFRCTFTEGRFEFFAGHMTTAHGLATCDPAAAITVTRFGAKSSTHHGWMTERDLPPCANVQALLDFITHESSTIEIVECTVIIHQTATDDGRHDLDGGDFELSTHDDGECHFVFTHPAAWMTTMKKVVPSPHEDLVLHELVKNPGVYVTCDAAGVIRTYATFDAWLQATNTR